MRVVKELLSPEITPLTRFAGRDPRGVTNSTRPVTYRCKTRR